MIISDLEALKAKLLQDRNIEIKTPNFADLHDPGQFLGMQQALERIHQAIQNQERIIIYGDFDADGITATVILVEGLKSLGAQVSYRIPDRNTQSHGLKKEIIEEIAAKNVALLITCDCGINDQEQVAYAASKNIDVIITDHHTPDPSKFPEKALTVINPHLEHCSYPEKNLSGSAIAFKLIQALGVKNINKYLEIATIGLIADCMELTGENRILAQLGLQALKQTQWGALKKLFDFTQTDYKSINEQTIGFVIAPRLNAASRLGNVLNATQLFLGPENEQSTHLQKLEALNNQRKQKTEQAFTQSLKQINKADPVQFLFHEDWDLGILGLVAGRQAEKLNQPIIAASLNHKGELHASCRCPRGLSIIQALQASAEDLTSFGGHAGAAGFQCDPTSRERLQQNLKNYFQSQPPAIQKSKTDAWIHPKLLNFQTLDLLHHLAPFGPGNPEPILGLKDVEIVDFKAMGQNKNHLRIWGKSGDDIHEFIAFFAEDLIRETQTGQVKDLHFTLSENYWKGTRKMQLKLI